MSRVRSGHAARPPLVAGALFFLVGCASGGGVPEPAISDTPIQPVPVYDVPEDVGCVYEPMGPVEGQARFTSSSNLSRDVARALGEAGARQGAHAVIRSKAVRVPFTIERIRARDVPAGTAGPGRRVPPGEGRTPNVDDVARGLEFPVEGLMIRFTAPCAEAGYEGSATDTLPDPAVR